MQVSYNSSLALLRTGAHHQDKRHGFHIWLSPLYCWHGKGHWQQVRIQNTRLDIPKVNRMMAWQNTRVSTSTRITAPGYTIHCQGHERRDNGDQPRLTDESSQLILLSSPIDMQGARHIKQLLWLCVVIYCYSCTDRRQKLIRGAN